MAYDLNSLIRMKDLKVVSQKIKAELQNSGGGSGGGSIEWPDNDDKYYAAKNGAWVEVTPAIMIETETGEAPTALSPLKWSDCVQLSLSSRNYALRPFSVDGTMYIIVSPSGTNSRYPAVIYKSTDGKKWSTLSGFPDHFASSGETNGYTSICYNEENKFLYHLFNTSSKSQVLYALSLDNPTKRYSIVDGNVLDYIYQLIYSPELHCVLALAGKRPSGYNGAVVTGTPVVDNTSTPFYSQELDAIKMSRYGVTWSSDLGIFCAGGQEGTAVSSDGINWINQLNVKGIARIKWNPVHKIFYGFKKNVPCISPDGLTWVEMTEHAVPNQTSYPYSVDYAPELGIYIVAFVNKCYISNDLKHFSEVQYGKYNNSGSYGTYLCKWMPPEHNMFLGHNGSGNNPYISTLEF